jgi:YHYH protein
MRRLGWTGAGCVALVAAACAIVASAGFGAGGYATTPTSPGPINPAAIPLGDGYISSSPKVGYVDSCQTQFGGMGGAQADGPWIDTAARTWNSSTKLAVAGAVNWPNASWAVTASGGQRVIRTNDLPKGHASGVFPIGSTDPASAYDRNPNHIAPQSIVWSLPLHPSAAPAPSCTSGGPIGMLDDGVVLFNALDGEGRDAAAHEVLDICAGHPDMMSIYHHHDIPPCILDKAKGASTLVGYAIDGYGIYVERDASGALLTNTALDACHGRTSRVLWNGKLTSIYHYDATLEYPYTVGCYHGTPIPTHP